MSHNHNGVFDDEIGAETEYKRYDRGAKRERDWILENSKLAPTLLGRRIGAGLHRCGVSFDGGEAIFARAIHMNSFTMRAPFWLLKRFTERCRNRNGITSSKTSAAKIKASVQPTRA